MEIDNPKIYRYKYNPIISPRSNNPWEYRGTFNPAAIKIGDKVYLIYRQISKNGISTFGLAILDGLEVIDRLDEPIYLPRSYYDTHPNYIHKIDPTTKIEEIKKIYSSGESYFGAEDPRAVIIGEYIYVSYVGYNGIDPPRSLITRIKIKDFINERWDKWEDPILVTHKEIIDKGVVMFSKKYKNKYCFFHRIYPNIWFDCVNELEEFKQGRFLYGEPLIKIRPQFWDNRKIGPGAPPIQYKKYWLFVYFGVTGWDDYLYYLGYNKENFLLEDGYRYKVGLMILDYEYIYKHLFRSPKPLLEPTTWYELHYPKPNVIYPTGLVMQAAPLIIYSGPSDYFVAGAYIPKEEIDKLIEIIDSKREEILGIRKRKLKKRIKKKVGMKEVNVKIKKYNLFEKLKIIIKRIILKLKNLIKNVIKKIFR